MFGRLCQLPSCGTVLNRFGSRINRLPRAYSAGSTAPASSGLSSTFAALSGGLLAGGLAVYSFGPKEATQQSGTRGPHSYERKVYIMRGIPGSGKSTQVRKILRDHLAASGVTGIEDLSPVARGLVLSTDDFFAKIDERTGEERYEFDFKKLKENHAKNQVRCDIAMELGMSPLFVDNTNTSSWEMTRYVELAKQHAYKVEIVDVLKLQPDLTLDVIKQRVKARSAVGKDIPDSALDRMMNNYHREVLPQDPAEAEAAILNAVPPWAKKAEDIK